MRKDVYGYCKIQNKNVTIKIEIISSDTLEGTEYVKAGIDCEYNNANHTCNRNDCPIWRNFTPSF